MKQLIFILFACTLSTIAISQVEYPPAKTEQQLENLAEAEEMETEDDSYLQSLAQFRRNKINLNTAEISDLKELLILNDLQIQNLIRYRTLLGNFISIYELQSIPTWDLELIQKILPFVRADNAVPLAADMKQRFTNGQHSVLVRAQQILEKNDGLLRPDSVANRYLGSPQRLFVRYKYVYRNLLQFGIVGDKDAGEQFFKGKQNKGFDFYSFHLFARKIGPIKLLAIGDFTVNMGQGLIHWQSLAFKKSADVVAVKRQADILRPYNSAGEYNFQRGVGITLGHKAIQFTAFGSIRQLDANFNVDTSLTTEDFISSILNSGYHRTPSELTKKNTTTQTSFGGNVSYNKNSFHIGANAVGFKFSSPLRRNIQPYNQFGIQGDNWHNYSIDYSYTWRNLHFFGEAAMDKNSSRAFTNGLLVSLDQRVDASMVYRNIQSTYQTLYGNAFTESTFPTNEKGLFTGLTIRPVPALRVDAYADIFSFPWLRFRVDAPSTGTDYLIQLTYRPNKQVDIYTRFLNSNKAINLSGLALPTRQTVIRPKQNWRIQSSYKASREVTLKNRVEIVWYDSKNKDLAQQGFTTYFDIGYKPFSKPYAVGGRLQYFETDGFDTRLYTFENDVLYSFSIPFFSGKGTRYYINMNYDVSKKVTAWLRFAQTIYSGETSVGSGLDAIKGNKRSEIKLQVMYNL